MKWEKFISAGFRMPFYMNLFVKGHIDGVRKVTGWDRPQALVVIEHQMNTVYESPEALADYRVYIVEKLKTREFRDHFIASFEKADRDLTEFCRTLYFHDYVEDDLAEIGRQLNQFVILFTHKFGIYGLPKFTDLALSTMIPELLSVSLTDIELAESTKPTHLSEYTEERVAFLSLAKIIYDNSTLKSLWNNSVAEIIDQLGRFHPEFYFKIESHVRKFSWLSVSHHVQPMTLEIAIENLRQALHDTTFQKELMDKQDEISPTIARQEAIKEKYKLTEADQDFLGFIRSLNEINESRKVAMSKALLWSYPLFQALADRLSIDAISLRQLTAEELATIVADGKLSDTMRNVAQQRLEYYVCLLDKTGIHNFSGAEAKEVADRELGVVDYEHTTEIRGKVAQPGHAVGKVRLILSEHQVENLLPGEILVTSMTDPDMVPAMKKAAAIVTDEGGITCHAAIVSRELKVPCVIGTKIATKVFKDGDMVDVDAETGVVRKLI